jgi:O-antigen ligase
MAITATALADSMRIAASVELPDAFRSAGPLWILAALALAPFVLLAMRKFRAAFIPPIIFVGYLKTVESKGLSLNDPTIIALLLLCGSIVLELLFVITRKDPNGQREFLTQWRGVASFGALSAVTAVSYLYSPAPNYGWDKLTRFLVISGILFFAPLVLIKKTDDVRHFTLAMLICAMLLSTKLLFGVNDASLFNSAGHPLSSESRDVTQIGAGQVVGFGLLWLLFCPHCSMRRFSLMISIPLLCAALIASVARGPILFFVAVLVPFLFFRRVRDAVTATNAWLPVLLGGLLAFAGSLYWLPRQEAAQGKFRTKIAEIEEVLRGSSTPTYTAGRRLTLYRWALGMFAEKPLTGWGLGGWSYYVLDRDVPAYPHNLVLEIAAEEGVMGLAALGTLFLTVLLAMRRIWRSSPDLSFIAPVFAFSLLATMTSGDINVNRPLWLWCGVIFALAGIAQRRLLSGSAVEWLTFPTNPFRFGRDRPPLKDSSIYS